MSWVWSFVTLVGCDLWISDEDLCGPGVNRVRYYLDADEDGAGDPAAGGGCVPASRYVPNADDCDDADPTRHPETPQYRDADGDGVGEWVEFDTCCVDRGALVVEVAPGFHKSAKGWEKNNRIAEAYVSVSSGGASWSGVVGFEDRLIDQYFSVPGVACVGDTVTVRLKVTKVVRGSKYRDTCVSDMAVWAQQ